MWFAALRVMKLSRRAGQDVGNGWAWSSLALWCVVQTGWSQPTCHFFLTGTLGAAPIQMHLDAGHGVWSRYFYEQSEGGRLMLSSSNSFEHIWLTEYVEGKGFGAPTGRWDGRLRERQFTGTWTSTNGTRRFPFRLGDRKSVV